MRFRVIFDENGNYIPQKLNELSGIWCSYYYEPISPSYSGLAMSHFPGWLTEIEAILMKENEGIDTIYRKSFSKKKDAIKFCKDFEEKITTKTNIVWDSEEELNK